MPESRSQILKHRETKGYPQNDSSGKQRNDPKAPDNAILFILVAGLRFS